jgi:hypothetical protein
MSATYRDYGKWNFFNTYVQANPGTSPPDSAIKITKLTSTQMDMSVTFQGFNISISYSGQIDLSQLTTSINTLEDVGIARAQGTLIGKIQSLLARVDGENAALLTTSPSMSTDDFNVLFESKDLAAMKRVLNGDDVYITSSGSEDSNSYFLYDGNDTLYHNHILLKYSDKFYGGNGRDTVVFDKVSTGFTIKAGSVWNELTQKSDLTGFTVTDKNKVINTLEVNQVERFKFSDTNVALDIAPTDNAGSVYMLYKAAFNRAPDAGGMGYWLAQKDSGKDIVTSLAQGFVGSKEFTDKYGTNPNNASYVDKLYQNVLGRAGESGGVTYWNQELDAGRITKAAVLVQFATLSEGAANVASLIANGIPYTEYVG